MKAGELDRVTAAAIEQALSGFSLPLSDSWTHEQLAEAVRQALSLPQRHFQSQRLSNQDIRKRIQKLSAAASKLADGFENLGGQAEWHIAGSSFKASGMNNFLGFLHSDRTGYATFYRWASQARLMAQYLESVAEDVSRQSPQWRQKVNRDRRVVAGAALIPVFEQAFKTTVTVNNWPFDGRHSKPTPFMEFFQLIMKVAFRENVTSDISGILKEARRLYTQM
jgi:hypothetical protein